jgi:oligopeptide/dipeptide ABC transporter ATP-binding protein
MYAGKVVETAPRDELLFSPKHPYTAMLLSAVPKVTRLGEVTRASTQGEPPNLLQLPSGCVFHPRCAFAQEICKHDVPALRSVRPEHLVSCHLVEGLQLRGV